MLADQLGLRFMQFKGTLAEGADENFKQSGIQGLLRKTLFNQRHEINVHHTGRRLKLRRHR